MNLESLDQKLWVALACPTSGLEIDAQTLSLIDTDQDGRVRAGELIAAVKFAGGNPPRTRRRWPRCGTTPWRPCSARARS